MTNKYEESGRLRKVISMVAAIDQAAIKKDIDPHGNAGQVLVACIGWTAKDWAVVDREAKLKRPSSPKTREEVKRVYRVRANKEPLDFAS